MQTRAFQMSFLVCSFCEGKQFARKLTADGSNFFPIYL